MNYEIIKNKEFKVIGTCIRTTNENLQSIKDQQKLWNTFLNHNLGDKIPNIVNKSKMFGIYYDFESDFTKPYSYLIGFKVKDFSIIPDGMSKVVVKKGEYAKFICQGNTTEENISSGWQTIWNTNLNRLYSTDIEEYDLFNLNNNVNIFIGIK